MSATDFNYFPSKMFINGAWVQSVSNKTFEVCNGFCFAQAICVFFVVQLTFVISQVTDPATNKLLGAVPDSNVDDLNVAVDAAAQAFKTWSAFTAEVLFFNST